jgi:putative phosphoribosyl transferase
VKNMRFKNRRDAGRQLAALLRQKAPNLREPLVLALPRGGVAVGYELAKALGCPLDLVLVRKLGAPHNPECAFGAIASGGLRVLKPEIVALLGLSEAEINQVVEREQHELHRREALYRRGRPPVEIAKRNIVIVDDGLATGATMQAALELLRRKQPASLTVAVPIAPQSTCVELRAYADLVLCLETPDPFYGVGQGYEDFRQCSDAEVLGFLNPSW